MKIKSVVFFALVVALAFVFIAEPANAAEKAVTQGEFAVALAKKLKLEGALTPTGAFEKLEELGVEPKDGWEKDKEMTPDMVLEIYRQLVDAIQDGELELTVGELDKIIRNLSDSYKLPLPAKLPSPSGPVLAPAPSTLGVSGGGGASVSE